jgi:hypothetical protein
VHDDALEFPDGTFVLLTYLHEGQQATVLQLPAQRGCVGYLDKWKGDLVDKARELASKCHLPVHQQQSSFDPRPVFAI